MPNFIYPRTIAISRPGAAPVAGDGGYSGLPQGSETTVATGIPASIQFSRSGSQPLAKVPSDVAGRATPVDVLIPRNALTNGTVELRDIVTDDLGQRYQVIAPYWDSMGYALRVMLLEA